MNKENPAKVFLRRYRAICGRVDALQRAIDDAMSRAFNTGVTLKEIKVLSSPAEHDPMARDVCNAVDACEILYQKKAEAERSRSRRTDWSAGMRCWLTESPVFRRGAWSSRRCRGV